MNTFFFYVICINFFYCVKNLDINETYLLFYINEPSIIIGKNQNTVEEINADYVKEKGIHVV
ncbi:lipoyl protein ligase domain-containing protein, partial [Bacillus sp. B-TM1]